LKFEDDLNELYTLKISALLHDIGKPECWANQRKPREHVVFTEKLVAPLGERISRISSHHHVGESYGKNLPADYKARKEEKEEWVTHVADFIASGADRRGEDEAAWEDKRGTALPIEISHVLSCGKPIKKMSKEDLLEVSQCITQKLQEVGACATSKPSDAYLKIYEFLEGYPLLRLVPADTQMPVNDVSLWHHLKLSAAVATSIWWDGIRVEDPEKYNFALLIGDADRIQDFINTSKRPPDLSARSEIIEKATKSAAKAIKTILKGPECVIFASAGGLLAIAPRNKVREITAYTEEKFRMATDDELKMVLHYEEADGLRLMEHIDEAWNELYLALRIRKLEHPTILKAEVKDDEFACDVCGFRPGSYEVTEHDQLPYDASPRYEKRCKVDYQRLMDQRGRGIKLDDIADKNELVAIIKTDGDNVANIFDGTKLRSLDKGKRVTPSRLSTISSLIDDICKIRLTETVKKYGMVEKESKNWIYAGGDDLLAVLPGIRAFDCANELETVFRDAMNDQATLSAGIVIFHKKFPIYVALEAVTQLLDNAKHQDGKASVDFEIILTLETTIEDLNKEKREKSKEAHLSGRPYKWRRFKELQEFAKYLPDIMLRTQINAIAGVAFQEGVEAAKDYVKYQMGRGVIPWKFGEELIRNPNEKKLGYLEEGFFLDAFRIYNTVYREGDV
jgi:CRISPR/Cas system-associated protein Cas10 (large subunit of type III CRISPR-Cas system)